jgi:hypothetical protein
MITELCRSITNLRISLDFNGKTTDKVYTNSKEKDQQSKTIPQE